mgnify:CR=1 FL=1
MLINKLNFNFLLKNYLDVGNNLFLTGIFLLPSAFPLGALFLLISIFIPFKNKKVNFLNNKWNLIFFICLIIIFLSTIYNSILNPSDDLSDFDKSIIWLNLFNWIPIYFAYIGFQVYLKSEKQRLLFQKFLIAGTIPVIISCMMQFFLKIHGPFETLFGTIVWFNYELLLNAEEQVQRATGLFSNPNYLGLWLTACLPFSISLIKIEKNNSLNILILLFINILTIYFAFTTYSRNALLGIILTFIFLIERKKLINFVITFLISALIFIYFLPNLLNIGVFNLYVNNVFQKFASFTFSFDNPRIVIWSNAFDFISNRPILGWGAGTFPYIFSKNGNLDIPLTNYQHTHNLLIELAYNFGIPVALALISIFFLMLLKAYKKRDSFNGSSTEKILNRALFASFSIFLVAHLTDITYYDGKISILFAILLANLKNIIEDEACYISKTLTSDK